MLYKAFTPEEGKECQYLGCYILNWEPEWTTALPHGLEDMVAFVEVDEPEVSEQVATLKNQIKAIRERVESKRKTYYGTSSDGVTACRDILAAIDEITGEKNENPKNS